MSSVLVAGADPFAGAGFGFQVPQGSPGDIEAAARACLQQAGMLSQLSGDVSSGTRTAVASWQGQAEATYAAYAGRLVGVFEANAEAFDAAGRAMAAFAVELENAQRVTQQALRDCEASNNEMQGQLQAATEHGQTAQTLTQQAATAFHPQMQAELNHQASLAQGQADAANRAANTARGNLEAAQRRGQLAWETYQHEAQATARTVQAAGDQLQRVDRLAGGAPAPLAPLPGGVNVAAAFPSMASPFAPLGGGFEEAGVLPGVPLSTLDEYGILSGGAFSGVSAWAKGQLAELDNAPWLESRAAYFDSILGGPLSSVATAEEQAYAEAMAPQVAARLAALPEASAASLRQLVNFSDHFGGMFLGGVVDSGVRIAEGQNVVKSVGAGVGTTIGASVLGGGAGTACAAFGITAPIAPLCAAGGGAVGAVAGDWVGQQVGGLIDDVGNLL